ncbi:permease [Scheffersomyces amazonensis]|uniref:permease n=1 Tax=Scheffersomyces amazonensis TaxID=1078765 RepID=UPI00315C5121
MYVLHKGVKHVNQFLPFTNHWLILVASIPVSLSCGTLFAYSVYATQLVKQCHLDTSQSANLNISATIGSAFGAVFSGLVTDYYGTQLPMLISSLTTGFGYLWLYIQYNLGEDSSLWQLLGSMFLIGIGSVAGYFSSIKAVTVNFPNFKGTAQSITIASFAISSLIFSAIATHIFKGEAGPFIGFLSIACGLMIFIGFVFIRVDGYIDHTPVIIGEIEEIDETSDETSTIESSATETDRLLGNSKDQEIRLKQSSIDDLKHKSLRDTFLHPVFWYHYVILAIVQGLGQMYIYSVGFVLKALHYYFTRVVPPDVNSSIPSLIHLQALHVSIIAVASFLGRLTSGPASDFFVHKLHSQRHWVLIIGLSIMLTGHLLNSILIDIVALDLRTVNIYLSIASALIGYAYGFSFASYPAIVSDLFNMKNYSFIWGAMYTATTFGLTLMTKIFGYVYDGNTTKWDDKAQEYVCAKGSACYNLSFQITAGLCILAMVQILGYIYYRAYKTT